MKDSIYIALAWRGRGAGKLLPPPLIEAALTLGMHAILVGIDLESKASIRLYARFEFREVATSARSDINSAGDWMRSL